MIVLDAQALEALLVDEPAMDRVIELIETRQQVLISAVNLAEVADRMTRVHRSPRAEVEADVDELGLFVTAVDEELALLGAELRAAHYHGTRRSVSIADCIAAALALERAAPLATSDPALIDLMLDEGGLVEVLPDSTGTLYQRR